MRLVDTSAWIEWLVASPTGLALQPMMPEKHDWLVPTIVQLELAKWLLREAGEEQSDQVMSFTQTCVIAPLTTPIALLAAELCHKHRLATADAIIYATTLDYEADLLTCDAHFNGLPSVKYIANNRLIEKRQSFSPRHMVFTEIPKTSTGKIQKFKLRELAREA